jgi:hypothetical protein
MLVRGFFYGFVAGYLVLRFVPQPYPAAMLMVVGVTLMLSGLGVFRGER